MKKFIPFIMITLTLGACTSLRNLQMACEGLHDDFSDIVSCLDTQIEAEAFKPDSFEREYLLASKSLQEDLSAGKINETKAKLELEHLYNTLLIRRARLQALQSTLTPRQIDCRRVNANDISCRSF